ncbi:MAG: gamma-glutamylcyclotransferase [Crenarchaeota archaeon]|nr:gamma-glutamylcyclotransferase [Thermoproteota archaeon]
MPLLAVYGTLRRGFRNHELLKGCELVWEGYANLPYELVVDSVCIPYLVPVEELRKIYVEVYRVDEDALSRLDEFEDVPETYVRVELYIDPVGFAHIYVARRIPRARERVAGGDFLEFARSRAWCRHLLES